MGLINQEVIAANNDAHKATKSAIWVKEVRKCANGKTQYNEKSQCMSKGLASQL